MVVFFLVLHILPCVAHSHTLILLVSTPQLYFKLYWDPFQSSCYTSKINVSCVGPAILQNTDPFLVQDVLLSLLLLYKIQPWEKICH